MYFNFKEKLMKYFHRNLNYLKYKFQLKILIKICSLANIANIYYYYYINHNWFTSILNINLNSFSFSFDNLNSILKNMFDNNFINHLIKSNQNKIYYLFDIICKFGFIRFIKNRYNKK